MEWKALIDAKILQLGDGKWRHDVSVADYTRGVKVLSAQASPQASETKPKRARAGSSKASAKPGLKDPWVEQEPSWLYQQ